MAGERLQLDDFYSSWKRQYRQEEAPPSIFLHQMRTYRSSSDILTALEMEKDSLETQKRQIEKDLEKVKFCLWWIDQNKRDSGVGTYGEAGDEEFVPPEDTDSFQELEGVIQEKVKMRPIRKRSQSLQPAGLAELRAAVFQFEKRRGSFHGSTESDYENMSFKGPLSSSTPTPDRPPSGLSVSPNTRSRSFPVDRAEHSRESTHEEESNEDMLSPPHQATPTPDRPPSGLSVPGSNTFPAGGVEHSRESTHDEESDADDIYDDIMPHARDFSEVVAYLCRELPAKEASAIVHSMEGTKVRVTSDRDWLNETMTRWITEGKQGRLLHLLNEHRLYDIHSTVESILREDGTTIPPAVPSSPRPERHRFSSDIRKIKERSRETVSANFGQEAGRFFSGVVRDLVSASTGNLSRSHSSGARLFNPKPAEEERRSNPSATSDTTFRFGIRIIVDYVPAGIRDSLIDGYRWLSIVRGQLMDVIGIHNHVAGELYIVRNEEGEIGLVSPEKCEVLSNATPVLWTTEWFVTDTNQYSEKLRNAQIGAYYMRSSISNPGDLTLIVNTGSHAPTKFGIAIHASTYTLKVAGRGVYSCQSLKELITHYKTHFLPTDTPAKVCLTVSCKKIP